MSSTPAVPPLLGYRYEFHAGELDAIRACHDEHGFVIVKGLLSPWYVEELKDSVRQAVDPDGTLGPGETRFCLDFVERSRPLWRLLQDERYLAIARAVLGAHELTLHRSAAIIKNPGAAAGAWHTDWCGFRPGPPRHSGDVLNQGEHPSGFWFYLSGTHPDRGGIAIIEDSHRPDWSGPEGFEFTEHRGSFYPRGTEPKPYEGMDVPGVVPLFTDPGDMILFAARTYHGVFPHGGDEPRLSLALNFRTGRTRWPTPWELPDSARRFVDEAPAGVRPLVEHYPGLDTRWRPE